MWEQMAPSTNAKWKRLLLAAAVYIYSTRHRLSAYVPLNIPLLKSQTSVTVFGLMTYIIRAK